MGTLTNSTRLIDKIKNIKTTGVETTQPSNPVAGSTYYDTTNNTLMIYDGTQWNAVGGGGGGGGTVGSIDLLLVGGGGGGGGGGLRYRGSSSGGGGGGEVILGKCIVTYFPMCVDVQVGAGGAGGCDAYTAGGDGGNTIFGGFNARGGHGGNTMCGYGGGRGGASGNGNSGGSTYDNTSCSSVGFFAGGGGGAGGNGCNAVYWGACPTTYEGFGGPGICGYGGGGGGGGQYGCTRYGYPRHNYGKGCDGGGNGGYVTERQSGYSYVCMECLCGCNATKCGGGGGGAAICSCSCSGAAKGGDGGGGLVMICYKTNGSSGINCATGGTVTTSGEYTIHTFTSNGAFCVVC